MRLVDHPRAWARSHQGVLRLGKKDERRDPSRPRPTSDAHGKAGGRAPSLPSSRPWGLLSHAHALTQNWRTHTYTQSAPRTVNTGTQAVLHYVAGITRYRIRQRQEGPPASTALGLLNSRPVVMARRPEHVSGERFSGFGIPGGSPPVCFV